MRLVRIREAVSTELQAFLFIRGLSTPLCQESTRCRHQQRFVPDAIPARLNPSPDLVPGVPPSPTMSNRARRKQEWRIKTTDKMECG